MISMSSSCAAASRSTPSAGAPAVATNVQQTKSSGKQLWMVQFVGPIKQAWLARLRKMGIEVVAYMPNNAYVVWLDGGQLTQLEQQAKADPTVQWTGAYHPAYRIAPASPDREGRASGAARRRHGPILQDHRHTSLHRQPCAASAAKCCAARRMSSTSSTSPSKCRGNQIAAIAARADVFNVEPYTPPKKKDEAQGQIVAGQRDDQRRECRPDRAGLPPVADRAMASRTDPAQYPIVDVVDDGIDNGTTNPLHPDFHVDGVGHQRFPAHLQQ